MKTILPTPILKPALCVLLLVVILGLGVWLGECRAEKAFAIERADLTDRIASLEAALDAPHSMADGGDGWEEVEAREQAELARTP